MSETRARARPATPRQLQVCKRIASSTGRTFAVPLSFEDARAIIVGAKKRGAARARRRARKPREG